MNHTLVTLLTLLPLTSLAQQATMPAPAPAPAPASAAPASRRTAGPTPEVEEAVTRTAPDLKEQLAETQRRLEALEEKGNTAVADLLSLKRLKLSGYVQARFQAAEQSRDGADARGTPLVKDGFSVRRGRIKATYSADVAKLVLQVDATNKGVSLKDAEVHFIEPWTGHKLDLAAGQMKIPFGFEVLQSSSDRDFPERSQVVRAFAAGERDRGARLTGEVGILGFGVGLFDGNGVDARGFAGVDNDRNKDVIGRVGVDLGWLSVGASGWFGRTFRPENTTDPASVVPAETFDRSRLGADAQLYLDLFAFGSTSLKGEYITGRTWVKSGVEQFGAPALGWYATVTQHVGTRHAVAFRYDYFDSAPGVPNRATVRDGVAVPASTNPVGTFGVAYMHNLSDRLELTAAYEVPVTGTADGAVDPSDNVLTLQLQARY